MWKVSFNKSIRQLKFMVKGGPAHHGVWAFVRTKAPELALLNKNTTFFVDQISDEVHGFDSSVQVIYGDLDDTVEIIKTENLSPSGFEKILKEKIAHGLTLRRAPIVNDDDREIPLDIVEARSTVRFLDDEF